jgi:hypothetical protein
VALTVTRTRTHKATLFADPYKVCCQCGGWVDGFLDSAPLILVPCEHDQDYDSVCPSWGPVDGCRCAESLGAVPHARRPPADDGKVY